MKRMILILVMVLTLWGLSLSPIYIYGSGGTTVIDYCSEEHIFRPATWDVWGSFVNSIAQSFTGDGRTLNHCQFFLGRVFNPSGNIYAKLYAHSGTFGTSSVPTGAPLATSDPVDILTIPGEEGGLVTFNFPTPYTLINGTHYVLAVEFNGGDSRNKLYVYTCLGGGGSYHSGNTSSHALGSWNASANDDVIFYAISDQTNDVPDTTGPSLSITSHSNGQHVSTSSVTLAGTASDSGKGDNGIQQVTVNGAQASNSTASGSGIANWSKVISLNGGTNTIAVIAYDNSTNHNTTTQSITIYYDIPDTAGPSLSITSHSNGQHVAISSITLAGTASDSGKGGNGIQQVTVNGAQASNGTVTGSGTANWSKVVSLNGGTNTIMVIAYDNSTNHNTTTQSITIYYDVPDTTGPSLSITSHSNGQNVSTSSITLAGTASDSGKGDNGIQQVTVNGAQASNGTATGSGTANWSKVVSLSAGANAITSIAYDNSSNHNTTTQSIIIYYDAPDTTAPDTTITGGPSGVITYNNPTFTYTGSDNVTPPANLVYSTYLQGYDSVWSTYSSFAYKSYNNLPNGSYTFLVKAKDQAGNVDPTPATRSFTINYNVSFPFKDDFSTDKGWTGYELGGWERKPAAAGGGETGNPDPATDHTGLGGNYILGFAIGADYPNNLLVEEAIISPPINCTGQNKVFLKFRRYLNVEGSQPAPNVEGDHARIYVSTDRINWGLPVWENPPIDLMDNQWVPFTLDISSTAANQATVYIKFTMGPTNSSRRFSGWNIDDLEVTSEAIYLSEGTMGTEIAITGTGFGAKKGKASIGAVSLKILEWKEGLIHAALPMPIYPGVYDVMIQPSGTKGTPPIIESEGFTAKAPEIYSVHQTEGSAYDRVTISGKYFGTKKGKVYLEYGEGENLVRKSCKINSWKMDPTTGDSEIVFIVPPMLPNVCDVVVDPYGTIQEVGEEDEFTVKAPEIVSVNPHTGSAGDQITIHGHFLGTKKGKVYLGHEVEGKPTKKSCAVVSWVANPSTEEGDIIFVVPKGLPFGVYDVIVTNSVGSDTLTGGFISE